jgi:hypothetical protein
MKRQFVYWESTTETTQPKCYGEFLSLSRDS